MGVLVSFCDLPFKLPQDADGPCALDGHAILDFAVGCPRFHADLLYQFSEGSVVFDKDLLLEGVIAAGAEGVNPN